MKDKINAGRRRKASPSVIDGPTTKQFHADIAALGVLEPTVEPRATDHIAEMKVLIEALVANDNPPKPFLPLPRDPLRCSRQ